MGLYALWGPMQATAGPITPLVFLAAMLMTLPTAISYALLNRAAPSAAAASSWLWQAVGPLAGLQAGLLMTTYFLMAAIAQPLMFALFFRDFLHLLGVHWPDGVTLAVGAVLATVPVAVVCVRGAESSIKSTVRLMIIETVVVVALSLTIVVARSTVPDGINFDSFDPRHANGLPGFWLAMILGVLAFCGFDVVSTAAEEAHAPKEHLPKAILLTVIGIAVFWAINAWAFTLAAPDEAIRRYTAQGLTAVTPIAQAYWGWGSMMVILTAFTGLTAVYISSVQGTSRIVFALARHGALPRSLASLSGVQRVPRNSVLAVLATVLVLDLTSLYLLGNGLDSFTWWANALVFFAVLTFMCVNVANMLYFWRCARSDFGILKNLVVGLLGLAMNAYLLHAAFFSALWDLGWRTGRSVVFACLGFLALQLTAVVLLWKLKPQVYSQGTPIGVERAET